MSVERGPPADPKAIRDAVAAAGFEWTVADQDAGAYPAPYAPAPAAFRPPVRRPLFYLRRLFAAPPPPRRDWREGRELTPPREQGPHNTCSAFAVAGVASDLVSIRGGSPARPLSAGHLHRCLGGLSPDKAADPHTLATAVVTTAVAAESAGDYPFIGDCATAAGIQRIAGVAGLFSAGEAKAALGSGPVLAVMNLHDDFWPWYGGGVYQPVGQYQSAHSIVVVGYNDAGGYWIVRNSHGPGWGEGGYGKIRYGTCGIFGFHRGLRLTL